MNFIYECNTYLKLVLFDFSNFALFNKNAFSFDFVFKISCSFSFETSNSAKIMTLNDSLWYKLKKIFIFHHFHLIFLPHNVCLNYSWHFDWMNIFFFFFFTIDWSFVAAIPLGKFRFDAKSLTVMVLCISSIENYFCVSNSRSFDLWYECDQAL